MSQNVYDTLVERGYIKQMTHEKEIKELLEKEKITFYIGFDPTADSLHVGHFILSHECSDFKPFLGKFHHHAFAILQYS